MSRGRCAAGAPFASRGGRGRGRDRGRGRGADSIFEGFSDLKSPSSASPLHAHSKGAEEDAHSVAVRSVDTSSAPPLLEVTVFCSVSQSLVALKALPEFTRHLTTAHDEGTAGFRQLTSSVCTVAGAISCHMGASLEARHHDTSADGCEWAQRSAGGRNVGQMRIPTHVLELAWNRLRRVRQHLASAAPRQLPASSTSPPLRSSSSAAGAFLDSLIAEAVAPLALADRNADARCDASKAAHADCSTAASALSLCVAVALQDWEGIVSVVGPAALSSPAALGDSRGASSDVASSCGLFGSMAVELSGAEGTFDGCEALAACSDRAVLCGAKAIVSALVSEATVGRSREHDDDAAVGWAALADGYDGHDAAFVALSMRIAAAIWGDDTSAVFSALVLLPEEGACGGQSERGLRLSAGAVHFLRRLVQIGFASCVWRQREAAGLNARLASCYRPAPPSQPPSAEPSLPESLDVYAPSLETFSLMPRRFWGVPSEIEPLMTLCKY